MYHRYVYAYNYRATAWNWICKKINKIAIFTKDIYLNKLIIILSKYGGTKFAWSANFQRSNIICIFVEIEYSKK